MGKFFSDGVQESKEIIYCENCEKVLEKSSKFCKYCGTKQK